MALTPDELDQVARSTVELYQAAEEAILVQVRRRLAAGMDAADWQVQRLGQLSSLRRTVDRVLDVTAEQGGEHIRAAVGESWRAGTGRATLGVPAELLPDDPAAVAGQLARPPARVDVVESLAGELVSDVNRRHSNVLRHVTDVYRSTIQEAAAVSVAGGQTRRQAAQHAFQRFIDQGITGFTDIAGRRWRLSSYVEMGVRTVTQRAAVQGQTDRLQNLGRDLVIISDSPRECPRCRPWEGKVLSISGATPTGTQDMEHAAGRGMVEVTVDGTLDEARSAGLFHPNCTHSARAYLPGVTRRPEGPTADPEGDRAKQRQRDIERNIRKYKERELGALDPAAASSARGKTRAWQAEMREHLARNPELKRLPYRERIGGGNIPPTSAGIANAPGPRPTLQTPSLPAPARPPASTAGPGIGHDIIDDLDLPDLAPKSGVRGSTRGAAGDPALGDIAARQGYTAKPTVGSPADVDAVVARGGVELHRGVTEAQFAEAFKTGDYFPGLGLYGNGTYTSTARRTAAEYADSKGRNVTRMALTPEARTTTLSELERMMADDGISVGPTWMPNDRDRVLGDPGRYAAAKGIDAYMIDPPSSASVDLPAGEQWWVVLNRGAVVVER